jgi:hypothetical protein
MLLCDCHEQAALLFQTDSTPADLSPGHNRDRGGLNERAQRLSSAAFEAGKLLLYGPVIAPDGAFGLAIHEVGDEAEARPFGENGPSVRAGLNRGEFYPMRVSGSRAKG